MIRHVISKAAERCGFEVTRLSKSPGPSLAGIAHLPIQTVLDVGANRGQFARQALRLFPGASIYSFEPLPDAFAGLQSWISCEKLQRVRALPLALGSSNGSSSMFVHREHDPSSSLLATTEHARNLYSQTAVQSQIEVHIRTLDSLVNEGAVRISPVTLLKIDVQGFELEVLRGARRTLESIEAGIIEIGLQPLYHGQGSFMAVTELLASTGLRYVGNAAQVCDAQGRVVYIDAAFVRAAF